jgi:hypothetical protein
LFPLLPDAHAQAIEDEVTQLDLSARLSVTWALATAAASALLARDLPALAARPAWLLVPAALAALSAVSYRAAVESALAHGRDVEIALDLYRSLLLDASRFPPARRLSQERQQLDLLCELLETYTADHSIEVHYAKASGAGPR